MSDSIKIIVTFVIVLLAGVGLIAMSEQFLGPKAVLTEQNKPPAALELVILDNEIWLRLTDIYGQSTKFAGRVDIVLSRITKANPPNFAYEPMLSNTLPIDTFEMVYVNNRGNASNIYAAYTQVDLPKASGLYRIKATYYPRGEDYQLSDEIVRGV